MVKLIARAATAALVLLLWGAGHPAAQTGQEPHHSVRDVVAVRVSQPPRVDGRPDEPAWAAAPPAGGFIQMDPREGEPASEATEVRVLFDDEALYVGAWLHDAGGPVTSRLARRDASLTDSDWFTVSLDSYHDHQTVFRFQVNPSGVRVDEVSIGDRSGDRSWDPVWQYATAVSDSGWSVEMRIPFSQLRFSRDDAQVWGVQFSRTISRTGEAADLAFTPRRDQGGPTRFAHLVGLEGLRAGRRLEVVPYALARAEYLQVPLERDGVDFRNPYRTGSDHFAGAGLDVKFRPSSSLTVDVAVNPDFGQVEVDPAVVNLTAFETFFAERRPFFVEGANLFSFGNGSQIFYSRRIGRAPQGSAGSGAVFSDVPPATTILGAAKLTGRTRRGLSFGVVEALTAREMALWIDREGVRHRGAAEPRTNYFAGRLRQDLRGGRTVVGTMGTAVHRGLESESLGHLRSSAYTGGIDFSHEWANRGWRLSGFISGSRVAGSPRALLATQRSSTRYYQRPDADHLEIDSAATSMAGYEGGLRLSKQAGLNWRGGMVLRATSPGFEVNDLGFQSHADRLNARAYATYRENRPGRVLRHWYLNPGIGMEGNYGGDLLGLSVYLQAEARRLDYWTGNVYVRHSFPTMDDRLTRGGPLARAPRETFTSAFVRSDFRRPVTLAANASAGFGEAGARSHSIGFQVGIKPSPSWSASLGPGYSFTRAPTHYFTSVGDAHAVSTFGRRYVFADLRQTALGLEGRLNVTFTPTLSLEMFVQPLAVGGEYGEIKELAAPGTYRFHRYGLDAGTIAYDSAAGIHRIDPDGEDGPAGAFTLRDRDFSFRSLRGNAVLRWEWGTGSTLFLVWQQRRAEHVPGSGPFELLHEVDRLLHVPSDHILLVKMTYWLNF